MKPRLPCALFAGLCLLAPGAAADAIAPRAAVNDGPHRLSGEVGAFQATKHEGTGFALGVGYSYRPMRGLEGGLGLRTFVMPDRESDAYLPQPVGSTAPPAHFVEEGYHFHTIQACVRPFLPLGATERFELGLELRAGLLLRDSLVLGNVAVAPDVHVRVAPSTALELAVEFFIGGTGQKNGPDTTDHVDELFAQGALFLRVVQTL